MAATVTIADIANKIVKETTAYKLPPNPKSLKAMSICADDLYTVVHERYALNKAVEALQKKEALLREHIIENVSKDSTGVAGKIASVAVKIKSVVTVKDWPKLYDYILKAAKKDPGAWSLLHKRVGDKAVQEIWEAGKDVPGVESMDVPVVSISKVG